MKKRNIRTILYSFVITLVLTILVGLGVLDWPDQWMQDHLYQKPQYMSGEVLLFGIDENSLAKLGPYNTWDRHIMARALEALNSDPEQKPAVVAIDTLYSMQTDPEADAHLAKAAEDLGCVVTATAAAYDSGWYEAPDGSLQWDDYRIVQYEEPYAQLKAVTTQGHINAMYDNDGIMRHGLLYIEPEQRVYSMAYQVVRKYLESRGEEFKAPQTNRRGQFYVAFTGRPKDYYDQSFADLVEGKIPPSYYAGKIVYIGPYAAGLQDAYFTPIDRAEAMYGVEFQANEAQQFLAQNYPREISNRLQYIVLFVVCFGTGILFFRWKLIPSTALCGALIGIPILVSVKVYDAGYILHPLWLPAGALIIYLFTVVVHYIQAARERQQITHTFERYVAPEIVQEILKEGTGALSLGGKLCDIAVLFVDVRGFTTMSERLEPEKVVYILNHYLTMASGCVEDNKGTLDKFVGDAMMAFWGAPLPQEDAVYNAVKTAQAIVDGAARVSDELKEEIGEEFRVGVGVHFGPAIVGNMGAERHMDYTAIGDTVNTAARLEANAPGGTVYISRAVADALGDRIEATSLGGTVKLKGKADGFEVLKLEKIL
ncbi:MAG: adenylate/guanylate cyclase domain-containing protein [Lachnospiraceae bacterium]|nr:adenylate/guanylate cyclase domain-containing protein [Lachnospiraceae bacterium]MBO6299510.1 adenylate/guanylate cyclase domain-containing protein [Lachnospiraceae bacterium]MBP3297484.1 adenylate/guanylate cyclase domain-containing protein [Lachnospiraceae bacterium]